VNNPAYIAGYMHKVAYGLADPNLVVERFEPGDTEYLGRELSTDESMDLEDDGITDPDMKAQMLKYLTKYRDEMAERGIEARFSNERYGQGQTVEEIKKVLQGPGPHHTYFSQDLTPKRRLMGLLAGKPFFEYDEKDSLVNIEGRPDPYKAMDEVFAKMNKKAAEPAPRRLSLRERLMGVGQEAQKGIQRLRNMERLQREMSAPDNPSRKPTILEPRGMKAALSAVNPLGGIPDLQERLQAAKGE
jgi:hypothetical protein